MMSLRIMFNMKNNRQTPQIEVYACFVSKSSVQVFNIAFCSTDLIC